MSSRSKEWDKKEKDKTEFLNIAHDYLRGLNYMKDSGLIEALRLKDRPKKQVDYLIGILALSFHEYELGSTNRKFYETAMSMFLNEYNLLNDKQITNSLKSTFDLIDSKKGVR